ALGMLPAALAIRLLVGEQHSEAGRWRRRTLIAVGVLTALSGAFSPLVALFAGLIGVGCFLSGRRDGGLALSIGAAAPLVFQEAWFPIDGHQPLILTVAWPPIAGALLVLLVTRRRLLRITALLYLAVVAVLYVYPTPVGSNVERFGYLLVAPIAVAFMTYQRRTLAVVGLLAVVLWQAYQPLHDVSHGIDGLAYTSNDQALLAE